MNQKGVIYIILSAILLYLYYRKRDLAIFAGFIVVVVGTLILGKGGEEGFGMGGGKKSGGINKDCAEMGFTQPKIDNDDFYGSLENVMKNIEEVAETKWPFEKGDIDGKRTKDKTVEANWKVIMDSPFLKVWVEKLANDKSKEFKEYLAMTYLLGPARALYQAFILEKTTDQNKMKVVNDNKKKLDKSIESGPMIMKFINRLKNSDDIKDADDGVKDILKYITCLVKQWIDIFKAIKKAMAAAGGGKKKSDDDDEGGGGDGEDEKPKKKKKKKSAEEEDEDEKPKKKKKKKSAVADDE
jgi:hypothetical protein